MRRMKTAVQIGAGNIGRGFMGQIFRDSGYRIIFVDVNQKLVDALNEKGRYEMRLVDNEGIQLKEIDEVSAVSGLNIEEAAEAIARADIMAVAVGVAALQKLPPLLVAGFRRRWRENNRSPLNILVCENLINAPDYLRALIHNLLTPPEIKLMEETVGLVETSIGRMVPGQSSGTDDPLSISVEPYCKLPVDRDAFVGQIPDLRYLEPFAPFIYHIRRKLYIHNFGHAILAYLGYALGKRFIWEAAEDGDIVRLYLFILGQVARGLAAEHKVDTGDIIGHSKELLHRYKNKALGDTVERVGRDPRRKLGPEDRIIGSYRLLTKYNLDTSGIPLIIAAALHFRPASDEAAQYIGALIKERGPGETVKEICGLRPDETGSLLPAVEEYYNLLNEDPGRVIKEFAGALK